MKVIYILHLSSLDGSTISFRNMLIQLMKKGVDPFIILPRRNLSKDFINFLDNNNIKYKIAKKVVFNINNNYDRTIYTRGWLQWFKHIITFQISRLCFNITISKIVKEFNPDIIHTNVGVIHEGYQVARKLGIPHIWHLREYQDLDFGYDIYPSKDCFIRKLKQSYVITISKDILRHFELHDYPKAFTIYNGINFRESAQLKLPKEKYFLCASRVSKEKGFEDTILAFSAFNKIRSDYKLLIAGKGEESYIDHLKELAINYECMSNIVFLGFRTDIQSLMSRATALLVGSYNEGFGRMTAEAAFAGCMVVGRNTGGTKEILNVTGGFLFDNVEEMTDHMLEIASMSDDMYNDLVRTVQNKAIDNYSIERNGEKVYEFYTQILSN